MTQNSEVMENKGQFVIPYPPLEVFKYRKRISAPFQDILQGENSSFLFDHIETPPEGGMYLYSKGVKYPMEGFVFPEALYAANATKRFTRQLMWLFASKAFILPFIGLILTRKKTKIKIIERFLDFYIESEFHQFSNFILEENRFSPLCRELRKMIVFAMSEYGINPELADRFAELFVSTIEYDNAYRWRLQDMLGIVTKDEILSDPLAAIEKMLTERFRREGVGNNAVNQTFSYPMRGIKLALWLPSIKRIFLDCIKNCEYKNLVMDEGAKHHSLLFADYDYQGLPCETRFQMFKDAYKDENGVEQLPVRIFYKMNG